MSISLEFHKNIKNETLPNNDEIVRVVQDTFDRFHTLSSQTLNPIQGGVVVVARTRIGSASYHQIGSPKNKEANLARAASAIAYLLDHPREYTSFPNKYKSSPKVIGDYSKVYDLDIPHPPLEFNVIQSEAYRLSSALIVAFSSDHHIEDNGAITIATGYLLGLINHTQAEVLAEQSVCNRYFHIGAQLLGRR